MKKIILILLILTSAVLGETSIDKALSSKIRAEVYAQNLVDGGYNKEAKSFLTAALKHYSQDETLLMFMGTTLYNMHDLQKSKEYFLLVLAKNSTNEQASEFIKLIEEQEDAKENKAVANIIDYLNDKGLDFLMIFFAFLGSEVIARKYNQCNLDDPLEVIEKYHIRHLLSKQLSQRIVFSLKHCCFTKSFFSLCSFIELLVTMTIVFAALIVWLFIEFAFEITLFFNESLLTLSIHEIEEHIFYSFITLSIIILILRLWMKINNYDSDIEKYKIELGGQIEKLFTEQDYQHFYTLIALLSKEDYTNVKKYIHNTEVAETIEERFKDT